MNGFSVWDMPLHSLMLSILTSHRCAVSSSHRLSCCQAHNNTLCLGISLRVYLHDSSLDLSSLDCMTLFFFYLSYNSLGIHTKNEGLCWRKEPARSPSSFQRVCEDQIIREKIAEAKETSERDQVFEPSPVGVPIRSTMDEFQISTLLF